MTQETIVIADAHLDAINGHLEHFLAFIEKLRDKKIRRFYMLGDLFNIWIGTPAMRLSHQESVVQALHTLRAQAIELIYIEGNRDYFLSNAYLHAPFHAVVSNFFQENIAGRQFYFSHGDLVNINDRQYHLWRKFSRNPLIFSLFRALPRKLAVSCAHYIEQKFRISNQQHKSYFPENICHTYAEELWEEGNDVIILGHFHERYHLAGPKNKHLHILPAWKDAYTYLKIDKKGLVFFDQFKP